MTWPLVGTPAVLAASSAPSLMTLHCGSSQVMITQGLLVGIFAFSGTDWLILVGTRREFSIALLAASTSADVAPPPEDELGEVDVDGEAVLVVELQALSSTVPMTATPSSCNGLRRESTSSM